MRTRRKKLINIFDCKTEKEMRYRAGIIEPAVERIRDALYGTDTKKLETFADFLARCAEATRDSEPYMTALTK